MDIEPKAPLARRIKGKHLISFKDYNIETNYYKVKIAEQIEEIHIFKVMFTPSIPADNTKLRMNLLERGMPEIKNFICKILYI